MLLEDQTREVITNTSNSHEFTIQNNAKMFQILSDKIYTYKPAAIVREISCNAYDAHIEAGIPNAPFRVVLPNSLHEYFEIEDFGVGLDEQQVYEVYTSYGASTKNNSNDVIGAFGLGSKTPFSYTTSFTIQTRKDGVEYLFNAYIGQNGAPTCSLLRKRDTDERNGVKIKIPVKSHHYDLFRRECEFILSFFPTRPEVVGDELFEFDFNEQVVKDLHDGKTVVENIDHVSSELYGNNRIYAMMGTVCYPVQMHDISSKVSPVKRQYLEEVVLKGRYGTAIFLNFPIGDLDVTASREALSIEEGKKTQTNLVKAFEDHIKDLMKEDEEAINNCTHPIQALSYLQEKYGDILHFVSNAFEFKGESLGQIAQKKYRSPYKELYFLCEQKYFWQNNTPTRLARIGGHAMSKYDHIILTARDKKTKGYVKYARELAKDNKGKIVVSTDNKVWTQHKIDRYTQFIGKDSIEVIYLEDIKETKSKPVGPSDRGTSNLPKKKKHEVTARSFWFKDCNAVYKQQERIDVDELRDLGYDVLYIEPSCSGDKDFITFRLDGLGVTVTDMMFGDITALTGKPMRLILSNQRNMKSIKDNEIQSLNDFMQDLVDNQKDTIEQYAKLCSNFEFIGHRVYIKDSPVLQYCLDAGSPLVSQEIYDLYELAQENMHLKSTSMYTNLFSRLLSQSTPKLDLGDTIAKCKEQYPMLKYISYGYSALVDDEKSKDCIDYIQSIDNEMKPTKKVA